MQHGDLCWVDDDEYPLIDGSIGEYEGADCGDYVFKCVKGKNPYNWNNTVLYVLLCDVTKLHLISSYGYRYFSECSKDQDCTTRFPYCIDGSCEGKMFTYNSCGKELLFVYNLEYF